jgi:Tfp pilus assembly protein PilO
MALNHKALVWRARRLVARIGWVGACGVGLAVFAVAFKLSVLSALDAELADLRVEAERLHMRYQMSLKQPVSLKRGPIQQLDTFYEFFPVVSTLPDWLLRLYAAAEKEGVTLELGDYKLIQEKGSRLARYQIMLPVKGSYGNIRAFIAAVLNDIPTAAVEDIALKRETIGAPALDARLKLTLFVRMESW